MADLAQMKWDEVPRHLQREYDIKRAWRDMMEPRHNASLRDRAVRRMERVDALPREIRALVYEYGLEIVNEYLQHKVTHAPNIAFLIKTVLSAERPHGVAVRKLFQARGVRATSIIFLIDTTLGADYENGQRRFKLNSGPNRRPNPIAQDDDDEAYYVLGPTVTSALQGSEAAGSPHTRQEGE
jgi:hypothetical protein